MRVRGADDREISTAFFGVLAGEEGITLVGGDNHAYGPSTLGFILRLNDDGTPDSGFHGGAARIDEQSGAYAALVREPRGYAVASTARVTQRARVARFDAAGQPLAGFGARGVATAEVTMSVRWLHVDPAGRYLTGGGSLENPGWNVRVARFRSDGQVDTTFGGRGHVEFGGLLADPGESRGVFAAGCDGRVTVAGRDGEGVAVARVLPSGTPDIDFGVNGTFSLPGRRIQRAVLVDPRDGATLVITQSGTVEAPTLQRWRVAS